jgi:hypothetical protein
MRTDYYATLARALLDIGDEPSSVAWFLRTEYGLKAGDAAQAIEKGQLITVEPDTLVVAGTATSRPTYRDTL